MAWSYPQGRDATGAAGLVAAGRSQALAGLVGADHAWVAATRRSALGLLGAAS
jgi:hypothetical protein